MNVAQETLGFRRAGLSPALSLLMSAFALPIPPAGFTPHLQRPTERSPTICAFPLIHSTPESTSGGRLVSASRQQLLASNELKWNAHIRDFGAQFEPRYIFRAGRLDQ
jgi:hypothetical protein